MKGKERKGGWKFQENRRMQDEKEIQGGEKKGKTGGEVEQEIT